ncbi:unnamed protein product [Rotaria sordida]|uniref:Uncharacterized protein n=1 Tax=Rotaria sordida TaxID=392033 RepID=A0A819D0B8_9BILA|nr:unnamed protein product [Rotaria sordida]CAF0828055.1 unnamed protein product [Rotaria sordida]CAF0891624.1 unnamed protein product [Rotaria sordida]CAF0896091.1 unnamed protein product [Rotaria sordida]CAF1133204.1 unnamed protein product [Rotaria sordida]
MYSFHRKLTAFIFIFFLVICCIHSFRINELENAINGKNLINDQAITAAQLHALEQVLNRRSLYDPAYSDSWSNYLEKKRSLFDPAYSDWANSFKRSDE